MPRIKASPKKCVKTSNPQQSSNTWVFLLKGELIVLDVADSVGASIWERFIVNVKDVVLNTFLTLMVVECCLIFRYVHILASDFVEYGCNEIYGFV